MALFSGKKERESKSDRLRINRKEQGERRCRIWEDNSSKGAAFFQFLLSLRWRLLLRQSFIVAIQRSKGSFSLSIFIHVSLMLLSFVVCLIDCLRVAILSQNSVLEKKKSPKWTKSCFFVYFHVWVLMFKLQIFSWWSFCLGSSVSVWVSWIKFRRN